MAVNDNLNDRRPDKWASRTNVATVDLNADEYAMLCVHAAQAGLTPEEYLRSLFGFDP